MSEELKPCPFCGGDAEVNEIDDEYLSSCSECSANLGFFETEHDAITAWNTRVEKWLRNITPV